MDAAIQATLSDRGIEFVRVISWGYFTSSVILAHRTSEDDEGVDPITKTKRKVFRFHCHSQKVIGSLGYEL